MKQFTKNVGKKFEKAAFNVETVAKNVIKATAHRRQPSQDAQPQPPCIVGDEGDADRVLAFTTTTPPDPLPTPSQPMNQELSSDPLTTSQPLMSLPSPALQPPAALTAPVAAPAAVPMGVSPDAAAPAVVTAAAADRAVPLSATGVSPMSLSRDSSLTLPWWLASDCLLLLLIHEARHLPAVDPETRSCNTFVRVTVGDPEGGDTPVVQASTRVCHRNRNPQFEESFLFPLVRLAEDTRIRLAFYNRNGPGPAAVNPMGHMRTNLGFLLRDLAGEGRPLTHWYRLSPRSGGHRRGGAHGAAHEGDVCCSVMVVSRARGEQLRAALINSKLISPPLLTRRTAGHMLLVTLHSVRLQLGEGLDAAATLKILDQGFLQVEVKIGRTALTRPLDKYLVNASPDGCALTLTLPALELLLPLADSFQEGVLSWASKRSRDEVGDVKVYLLGPRHATLARTQVPIWDVPTSTQLAERLQQQRYASRQTTNASQPMANSSAGDAGTDAHSPQCSGGEDSNGGTMGDVTQSSVRRGTSAFTEPPPGLLVELAANCPTVSGGPPTAVSHEPPSANGDPRPLSGCTQRCLNALAGSSSLALLGLGLGFGLEPGAVQPHALLACTSRDVKRGRGSSISSHTPDPAEDPARLPTPPAPPTAPPPAPPTALPPAQPLVEAQADEDLSSRPADPCLPRSRTADSHLLAAGGLVVGGGGLERQAAKQQPGPWQGAGAGTRSRSSMSSTGAAECEDTACSSTAQGNGQCSDSNERPSLRQLGRCLASRLHLKAGGQPSPPTSLPDSPPGSARAPSSSSPTPHTANAATHPGQTQSQGQAQGQGPGQGPGQEGRQQQQQQQQAEQGGDGDLRGGGSPLTLPSPTPPWPRPLPASTSALSRPLSQAAAATAPSSPMIIRRDTVSDSPATRPFSLDSKPGALLAGQAGGGGAAGQAAGRGGAGAAGQGGRPGCSSPACGSPATSVGLLSAALQNRGGAGRGAAAAAGEGGAEAGGAGQGLLNGSGQFDLKGVEGEAGGEGGVSPAPCPDAATPGGINPAVDAGGGRGQALQGSAMGGQGAEGGGSQVSAVGGEGGDGIPSMLLMGKRYRRLMEDYGHLEGALAWELDVSLLLLPESEAQARIAEQAKAAGRMGQTVAPPSAISICNDDSSSSDDDGDDGGATTEDGMEGCAILKRSLGRRVSDSAAPEDIASGPSPATESRSSHTELPFTPITLPTPLEVVCADVLLATSPATLFDALLMPHHELVQKANTREGLRELEYPAWQPGLAPGGTRTLKYIRPLNMPIGPKAALAQELHTIEAYEPGGWVVSMHVTTNALKGDCFHVKVLWACAAHGQGGCRFQGSASVVFTKGVGMLKGTIQSAALSGTRKGITERVADLVATFGKAPQQPLPKPMARQPSSPRSNSAIRLGPSFRRSTSTRPSSSRAGTAAPPRPGLVGSAGQEAVPESDPANQGPGAGVGPEGEGGAAGPAGVGERGGAAGGKWVVQQAVSRLWQWWRGEGVRGGSEEGGQGQAGRGAGSRRSFLFRSGGARFGEAASGWGTGAPPGEGVGLPVCLALLRLLPSLLLSWGVLRLAAAAMLAAEQLRRAVDVWEQQGRAGAGRT